MQYLKQCSYGRCPPFSPPPVACVGFCSVSVCVVGAWQGSRRARVVVVPPGAVAQAAAVRWPHGVVSPPLWAQLGWVLLWGCGFWSSRAATVGASGLACYRGAELVLWALSCPVVLVARTVCAGPVHLLGLA